MTSFQDFSILAVGYSSLVAPIKPEILAQIQSLFAASTVAPVSLELVCGKETDYVTFPSSSLGQERWSAKSDLTSAFLSQTFACAKYNKF